MTASPFRRLTAAALALALSACASVSTRALPERGPGLLIPTSSIERLGANSAWDVLLSSAVSLSVREGPGGAPTFVTRRAGSRPQHTVLIVDGMPTLDLTTLQSIPARRLVSIRVVDRLSELPMTPYFGRAPTLVIHVTTRRAPL